MNGRPPHYETPEQLQKAIDDYFKNGVPLKKRVVTNQVTIEVPAPTISGLSYHLGFESRQSFYDYEKREGFSYTVKRARLFIEKEYEEMLAHGNTVGAIFALKNMGWKDKSEVENSGTQTFVWKEEKVYETEQKADNSP